jgi:hypothetical protein
MHELNDIPLDQILIEHYLFDLDQSVEKTAEILGKDKEYVKKIYDNYMRFICPIGRKAE